jgi:pimeloyl-ACP methyl ester carboxylesterase
VESLWLPEERAYLRFHDLPGAEPAIVFVHGLGSAASADYPAVARHPALAASRVVLPDLLGFGFSDRPSGFGYSPDDHAATLVALLRHLDLTGAYVVGHSMGGAIAIALAAAHPELVGRLVVAEGNLDPGGGTVSTPVAEQTEGDYIARGHERLIRAIRASGSSAVYAGTLQLADPLAMHRSSVGLVRGSIPTWREQLLSMTIPRACVFGELSLPDPDFERLRAAGLDVLVVPGAGHAMMHDNPDGFALALGEAFALVGADGAAIG